MVHYYSYLSVKEKKLITLDFSHTCYRRGDEYAKRLSAFVQTVCATWHPFRVLGFGVIFHHSVFKDMGSFSTVLCFRIWGHFSPLHVLGFGVIFCHSVLPLFQLLGSPIRETVVSVIMLPILGVLCLLLQTMWLWGLLHVASDELCYSGCLESGSFRFNT